MHLCTINCSQADPAPVRWQDDSMSTPNPLHEPFTVKVLNRGCSNDKYARLKIANMIIPDYPTDQRKKPSECGATITFNLNNNGNPENIKVIFVTDSSTKASVLKAVREWKFDCGKLTEAEKQVLKDAKFTYTFEFLFNAMNIEIGDPFN